jgi:hypothetical protein
MFPATVWCSKAGVLVFVSVFWQDASSSTTSLCAFVVVGSGSQKSGNVGSQGGQGVQVGIVSLV